MSLLDWQGIATDTWCQLMPVDLLAQAVIRQEEIGEAFEKDFTDNVLTKPAMFEWCRIWFGDNFMHDLRYLFEDNCDDLVGTARAFLSSLRQRGG